MPNYSHFHRLRISILVMVLIGGLFFAGFGAFSLYQDRQEAEQESSRALRNLSLAISQHNQHLFATTFGRLDLMADVVGHVNHEHPQWWKTEAQVQALNEQLRKILGKSHEINALNVIGRDGWLIASTTEFQMHTVQVADRDYMQFHLQRTQAQPHVSLPRVSRLRHDYGFVLSRGVYNADGQLMAVVAASVSISQLNHFYQLLALGEGGAITLLRLDGQTMNRYPFAPVYLEKNVRDDAIFQHMQSEPEGVIRAHSPYDDKDRLIHFRRIADLPLLAVVSQDEDATLVRWRENFWNMMVLMLLGLVGVSSMTWLTFSQLAKVEQATTLSLHDPLTILPNRRYFDEQLVKEWQRATRSQQSLAVLFIDVDFFKRYNDFYGHPAGDQCLREVASRLQSQILRGGDMLARYGGEEFVCVLPDTDQEGAALVAACFLKIMHDSPVPHAQSAIAPHVTVSIGYAAVHPSLQTTPAELLAWADEALYEAKQQGRDRAVASHAA